MERVSEQLSRLRQLGSSMADIIRVLATVPLGVPRCLERLVALLDTRPNNATPATPAQADDERKRAEWEGAEALVRMGRLHGQVAFAEWQVKLEKNLVEFQYSKVVRDIGVRACSSPLLLLPGPNSGTRNTFPHA